MSKTTKNLLIIFTLVCIIVFAVFCIELVMLNSSDDDEDDATGGSAISTNSPVGTTGPAPSGNSSQQPKSNAAPPSGAAIESPGQSPVDRNGKRYEWMYSSTEILTFYVDDELFVHTQMDEGEVFTYLDDENASLEVCLRGLPLGVEACANDILSGYLDDNEAFISGAGPIRRSDLTGLFGSGVNNGETFELWIHTIPDGDNDAFNDLGIAFVIRYKNNDQKNALYAILDTLELEDI